MLFTPISSINKTKDQQNQIMMNTKFNKKTLRPRGSGHGGSVKDASEKIPPMKPGRERNDTNLLSSSSPDRYRAKTANKFKSPNHIRLDCDPQIVLTPINLVNSNSGSQLPSSSSNSIKRRLRSGRVYSNLKSSTNAPLRSSTPFNKLGNTKLPGEPSVVCSTPTTLPGTSMSSLFPAVPAEQHSDNPPCCLLQLEDCRKLPSGNCVDVNPLSDGDPLIPCTLQAPSENDPDPLDSSPSVMTAQHASSPTKTTCSPQNVATNLTDPNTLFDISIGLNLSDKLAFASSEAIASDQEDLSDIVMGSSIDPDELMDCDLALPKVTPVFSVINSALSLSESVIPDLDQPDFDEIEIGNSIDPNVLSDPVVNGSNTISTKLCDELFDLTSSILEDAPNSPSSSHDQPHLKITTKESSKSPMTKKVSFGRTKSFKEKNLSQDKPHRRNCMPTVASPLAQAVDGCSSFPTQDSLESQKGKKKVPKSMIPTGNRALYSRKAKQHPSLSKIKAKQLCDEPSDSANSIPEDAPTSQLSSHDQPHFEITTNESSKSPMTKKVSCGRTKSFKEKNLSQDKTHRRNCMPTVASPLAQAVDGCSLSPTQDSLENQKEKKKVPKSMVPTGDYSLDHKYMETVAPKLPIDWPSVNMRDKWKQFEEKVESQLPKSHVDTLSRLNLLESKIYQVGVEIFGVIDRKVRKTTNKGSSRRVKECKKLVLDKNALKRSIDSASCMDVRNSYARELAVVVQRLRVMRRAEKKLKNKRSYTKAAREFHTNPYKAGKDLLNPSASTPLVADRVSLDTHRQKVLTDPFAGIPLEALEGLPPPAKEVLTPLSGGTFTWPEFEALLKTRRNASAPGTNMIPYIVYKCCESLARYLLNILRSVSNTQDIPVQWRCDKVIFIPKVSNPTGTEITEYRELALGNVEGKLFFSMVSNRLTKHIVDKFKFVNTSVQKGCMKNIPGCWEHMASVWEALSDAKLNKKNVATVWLDLANAYGTIPHNLILFALDRYQVDNKLFNIVKNYYAGLWSRSLLESAPSSWQQHQRGIFTGCTVSIILFVSAINVVIEYIQAEDTIGYTTHSGISLPPVRAFMDDMNLMSSSVENTSTLLDRSCVALEWARMKFRPDKSRCIVVEKGSVLEKTPFSTENKDQVGTTIPSIHTNPIKFLGRVVNGALNDRNSVAEIKDKLECGLKLIANAKLSGKAKIWILSHLLIPQIRWPLMIYEVSISTGVGLEQRISVFVRKWLRLPRSLMNVALYSKISPCALPLVSLTSVLRNSKVSAYLQLRESKDPKISLLNVNLKAGRMDVVKEVAAAEAEIKFRDIVGAPMSSEPPQIGATHASRSKPGLGRNPRKKTPKKDSKEYRKLVTKVSNDIHEEGYMQKAVASTVQCQWTRWVNYIHNDFTWHKLMNMPLSLISFCLNATYDTLPTPVNLARWKIPDVDGLCSLCPPKETRKKPAPRKPASRKAKTKATPKTSLETPSDDPPKATTAHILGSCPESLRQKRFSWRHDSVLFEIVNQIHSVASNANNQRSSAPKSHTFVKEGARVNSRRKSKTHPVGILSQASDWELRSDLDDTHTVPGFLAPTTLRPDIVIYSWTERKVIILELTCCCEQNFASWHAEKAGKYRKDLIPDMKRNGWHVDYFPIEVGARGYCSTSMRNCLLSLGFSNKKVGESLQRFGRVALEASFHIWLARNTKEWSFDEKQPWDDFRNPVDIMKPPSPGLKISLEPDKGRQVVQIPSQSIDLSKPTCPKPTPSKPPLQEERDRRVIELEADWYSNLSTSTAKSSAPSPCAWPIDPVATQPASPKQPLPSVKRVIVVKERLPYGLDNIGNTCYLNSLLQALLGVPDFWKPLASSYRQETVPPLVRKFLDVLSSMEQHNARKKVTSGKINETGVDTKPLLRKIQKAKADAGDPKFRWSNQNDAAEVLGVIFTGLTKTFVHWDVSSVKVRAYSKCIECSHKWHDQTAVQPCLILTPKGKLIDSWNEYSRPELTEGRSCVSCESTRVSMRNDLKRAPNILVIQLNRGLAGGKKNPTVVDVASQSFDLPRERKGRTVLVHYCLKAVVCHDSRSVKKGHYFTYSKRGKTWYRLSDEKVAPLKTNLVADSINTRHAYMYVFEKSV